MPDTDTLLTAKQHAEDMEAYVESGVARALSQGNRGPLTFTPDGSLHPEILKAYSETGFYIFEGVIAQREIEELRDDVVAMLDRAPVEPAAEVDAKGQPPLGHDMYFWMPALGDPLGGSAIAGGRHKVKMIEPKAPDGSPAEVIGVMSRMCEFMDAALRVYGHPQLLAVAEALNGPDFVPFTDSVFVKQPGLGPSISWHQDGVTHWNAPDWDEGIHGFNFQVQLYRCTPANALWVVPGTHRAGQIDTVKMVADNGGSDRLPDAVPLFCEAGDVSIVNRQALHGSFANSSPDPRVSVTFGFHRRAAVIGQSGALITPEDTVYDEARIRKRSSIIALAVDARARHFPDERPFLYKPLAGELDEFRWSEAAREGLRNYNQYDLAI